MNMFGVLSLVFLMIIGSSHQDSRKVQLKVAVYYETLQGLSQITFNSSILPGFRILSNEVDFDFDLIPFGRTRNEGSTFLCPNGEKECLMNKVHACVLKENSTLNNKMNFVKCALTQDDPSDTFFTKPCIKYWGFDYNHVSECYEGSRGDQLLDENAKKTSTLIPGLTEKFPVIVFNDIFNDELSEQSQKNFFYTACKVLNNSPKICEEAKL